MSPRSAPREEKARPPPRGSGLLLSPERFTDSDHVGLGRPARTVRAMTVAPTPVEVLIAARMDLATGLVRAVGELTSGADPAVVMDQMIELMEYLHDMVGAAIAEDVVRRPGP